MMKIFLCILIMLGVLPTSGYASGIFIGDFDGFGFDNVSSLVNFKGEPADKNEDGILGITENLPDLDENGAVVGSGDYFDNRSSIEINATHGAQFTDIAISSTAGISFTDVYFQFTFSIPTPSYSGYGHDHYLNVVYGDLAATRTFTGLVDGTESFVFQSSTNPAKNDGYIESDYIRIPWEYIADGSVLIEMITGASDPYLAIDYAFLDVEILTTDPIVIPEPMSILLLGLSGLGMARKIYYSYRILPK